MRKTLQALVAAISIFVAVLAIILFVYRLGEVRTSGERSSGAEYSILRNALMSIQTNNDMQDQSLRDRLIALYKGSERLLAAQVLDSNGLAIWNIPSGSSYFALPNAASVRAGYTAPEWSTVVFTTPLSEGIKLTALYATVRRSDISEAAKLPLIIAALWCLLVALSFTLLGRERKNSILPDKFDTAAPDILPPSEEKEADHSENLEDQEAIALAEEVVDIEAASPVTLAQPVKSAQPVIEAHPLQSDRPSQSIAEAARSGRTFEESLAKLEEEIQEWSSRHPEQSSRSAKIVGPRPIQEESDSQAQASDELDEEIREELDELEAAPEEEAAHDDENDLADSRETLQEFEELNAEAFSDKIPTIDDFLPPTTAPAAIPTLSHIPSQGFAQERLDIANLPMPLSLSDPQLEAKLSEELERNTKTEVSLMLIHCTVSSRSDPAAVALSVTIKDYIGSKDLVFEIYKGAFAVVLPSVDLGGALKMSEDLADVLSATLSLYKDIDGEAPVFIGISARSDRKLDAYKIYREASTAVHKAYSGGHSRILAFRPKA